MKGKNATDMALLIDAMDMLYTKSVGTYCLVSSDCDFTPLVLRLRADGKQVIGFGGKKAPAPFVASCTRFLYLDESGSSKPALVADAKPTTDRLKLDEKLLTMLRSAVEARTGDDGWATLGSVGAHISNQGSFDSRNYGFVKLSDLMAATDLFELKKTPMAGGATFFSVKLRH